MRAPAFRRGYLLLGLLEPGIAYALFNFGLERTSAADGAVLISLESVAIALFAAVFLGERLPRPLVIGATLGVGGAVFLAVSETHHGASLTGDALVVAGVVAAAGYSVVARRVASPGEAAVVTAFQLLAALTVAVLVWSAASAAGSSMFGRPSASEWVAAVATGLLGSAVPFLLFTSPRRAAAGRPHRAPSEPHPGLRGRGSGAAPRRRLAPPTQLVGAVVVVTGLGLASIDG